ncbi:TonB-dependent receptor [soil metagenome]
MKAGYLNSTALGLTILVGITLSGQAQAQAQTTTALPSSQDAEQAGGTQSAGVEDIVVTAQRRSQSIQDVPIAISAVTAQGIAKAGIQGTEALGIAVPTLQFSRQTANGGVPFIRGVGSSQATVNTESPVAVYIDDVYYGAPSSTLMSFNNIESIEVLKGPQGTLFGRNATGGVIHVHTKAPSHEPGGTMTFGYGRYDTYYGNAYFTGGLTDTAAMNLAVTGKRQEDGYGYNAATKSDIYKSWDWAVRSQLLWEPTDATKVTVTGDYAKSRGDIGQNVILFPGTLGQGGGRNSGKFVSYANPNDYGATKRWGVSANIEQEIGDLTARSVSAYRYSKFHFLLDSDGGGVGSPVIVSTDAIGIAKTYSQELQLLSPQSGPLKWIVGAFYYRADTGFDPIYLSGLAFAPQGGGTYNTSQQKLNSYSGFGEASYEFLPDTTLTAGLRYTTDRYSADFLVTDAVRTPISGTPYSSKANFSKLTYRAILDHKFSRDVMAYASYSRGFKSGGFNLSSPTFVVNGVSQQAPVIAPEVLDAFELGVKTELFDRILRFNIAGYYYNYSNLQVGVVQNGTVVTLNAATAHIKGIDIDYQFVPSSRLTVSGGVSVIDAKYSSFPNGPIFVPRPADCTSLSTTGPLTGGNTVCLGNLQGNKPSRSPKLTISTSATYTIPSAVGEFAINGSWYHNSGYFWEPDNRLRQPKYDLIGASLTWTAPNEAVALKVYGRNLLNEFYYSYVSASTTRDSYSPEMPRNYGIEASFKF